MRLPAGFLGTRADVLMDVVLIAMTLTPFILLYAIRLARRGAYVQHRAIQSGLLLVLLAAVVLFEVDVRLAGGSGSFLAGSKYAGSPALLWFLRVHIGVATLSMLTWLVVVAKGWRVPLEPGPHFGPAHRRTGWLIFAGVTFTSISGAALYYVGFVL